MIYRILADSIVVIHLAFIIFVTLGALLVLWWKKLAWVHIPMALWGILVEFSGWICPLTPWENYFRRLAGEEAYKGDFIGEYILPLIYPEELTRNIQLLLGSFVVMINLLIYGYLIFRFRKSGVKKDWDET
jgi:hypothetical protein